MKQFQYSLFLLFLSVTSSKPKNKIVPACVELLQENHPQQMTVIAGNYFQLQLYFHLEHCSAESEMNEVYYSTIFAKANFPPSKVF